MTPRPFSFATMHDELRMMSDDERAETIVEMFKISASEFAAMVLDHTKSTTGHTLPNDDNPIRTRLRDLGTEERARFLGLLFKDIMDEFAALIVERAKH
jgi:hypothetical protein